MPAFLFLAGVDYEIAGKLYKLKTGAGGGGYDTRDGKTRKIPEKFNI